MGDEIIVLDEDNEESPQPSISAATPSSEHGSRNALPPKRKQQVLLTENQKLFSEFVKHCSSHTKECPEVLEYLHLKHSKTSPEFLSSVEFRNSLKGCLTRAQNNRSKTFVFINELCTVLKQHRDNRRLTLSKAASSTSTSAFVHSTSDPLSSEKRSEEEQPSTSGIQEDNKEQDQKEEKRAQRASRKQIAYLENLLKVYNDEIFRLQQTELSLNDLEAEDSIYIQEHKLKRKLMKIYEKLCELKGCNTLTGRAIEERIEYKSTRYPEINKRIQRYINSPEVQQNPPDYQDILQQVLRANQRHNLCLSRSHLNQIAQEAFRETGNLLQRRRLNDMFYNFGSHLTDSYKPTSDPALSDQSLQQKLRSNREVAMSRLEEVITKYAVKQEDVEELERLKRQGKDTANKEVKTKVTNGVAEEEEEEEDDEDDESSDPDIKDEIEASTQQGGPDDDDNDDGNEAENASEGDNKEEQAVERSPDVFEDEEEPTANGSPASDETKSQISPISDMSSPQSPAHFEPTQEHGEQALLNGNSDPPQEPTDSSKQVSPAFEATHQSTEEPSRVSGEKSSTEQQTAEKCDAQTTNGISALPSRNSFQKAGQELPVHTAPQEEQGQCGDPVRPLRDHRPLRLRLMPALHRRSIDIISRRVSLSGVEEDDFFMEALTFAAFRLVT
uniref:Death domain-associated protein 6 n=1 Tax=Oryzias dancena TaxID=291360 RepID=C0JW46_ORYDN|nr:death-associated protein 6 [Oryzias dancena]